ncbi:FKBP12-associated protein 1-like protein [Lachnellula hyalina]|uniref:FKBP12-associated protein 1-like protein n=1 Tax=Lachnellula hyalina TaxID=1316788 RepID=A0A8H8TZP2_9HELO|nr:FKBP12-associated protein 1-like protein [Lachnellula hyalina]TVY26077.1 FKBP12-associated protein 1-like protein [Lachnellula hyalina]
MSAVETAPPPAGRNRPPRNRRGRGGNRGGATGTATAPNPAPQTANTPLVLRPASLAPESTLPPTSNSNRGGRGRRGGLGRGGRRGGAQPMVNGQRAFGGQLTSNVPSTEGSLAGDAPVFIPGQPVAPRARQHQVPRPRRMSKSQAPDIASRTHEDITNGQYECAICTNEVLPNSKIWSCKTCWSVLHLTCVKRWSKNEISTHQQRANDNGELPPPRQWRCPGCNLPKDGLPNEYTYWDIVRIPASLFAMLVLVCLVAIWALLCLASVGRRPRRGDVRIRIMTVDGAVGRFAMTSFLVGNIIVREDVMKAYVGAVKKPVACSERDEERQSQSEDETWTGSFDCGAECKRPYDCGNADHFCEKACHVQDLQSAHCPYSPDVVTHCPCGKTPLSSLLEENRKDCSAPIPHCKEKCENLLQCGHICQQTCHEGECRPCLQTVQIACRCGRTTSKTICHQGTEEPPSCMRICRATLNCGRHECGERCCPGEKKASERQALKRKHRGLSAAPRGDENIEAEHICLKVLVQAVLKLYSKISAVLVVELFSNHHSHVELDPLNAASTAPADEHVAIPKSSTNAIKIRNPVPNAHFWSKSPASVARRASKTNPAGSLKSAAAFPAARNSNAEFTPAKSPATAPANAKTHLHPAPSLAAARRQFANTPARTPAMLLTRVKNFSPAKPKHSSLADGNTGKVLECTDDCLKLQRNAKLAAALNIDPATHLNDHIPYSQTTLDLFREAPKFAQVQEREFRVFAADEKEKRLRFKPMQPSQRAFIHALAEDFGLDSESQDPEPHRHVSIFKTPRFVSAPMKTLSQCIKLKAIPVAAPEPSSKGLVSSAEPYNAFVLSNPKFGLTIDELRTDLHAEFSAAGFEAFDVAFLPSGDIVLKPLPSHFLAAHKLELSLSSAKSSIVKKVQALELAASTALCAVDSSLNVARREDDNASGGGWSQVAKGAGRKLAVREKEVGHKSSFTVLGSRKRESKKEEVADDWEREVEKEGWDDA